MRDFGIVLVMAILNALAWGLLVFLGQDVLNAIAEQHSAGYPSEAQLAYYQYVPACIVAISLALLVPAAWKRARNTLYVVEVLMLFALVPFILAYTRGM